MKKKYLVDVPVKLNVFIRPNKLEKVFEVVRVARPSILFLVSDGPRKGFPNDEELIMKSRKLVENIDWECTVYRIYSDTNQGMSNTGKVARKFIFDKVDRCIMLEDDVVPSVSFFRFCQELLEKYKDDLRIHRICGMNHLGIYEECDSDYFFSREGSIWGCAIWKRTYESFDYDFAYGKSHYIMSLLSKQSDEAKKMWNQYLSYAKGKPYKNSTAGPEFFYAAATDLHNQLNIVARKNLISNIGIGEGSVHSANSIKLLSKGISKVFYMKTYEYEFPLKHPSFVVEDKTYQKKVNRIMGWGHPLVKTYRKLERCLRLALFSKST